MFKRVFSLLLCILMIATMGLSLCSCKGEESDEYPVTVAGITIEKEPQNIVVLSDCLADIVSYIGYDIKMVGRNMETDQEFLSVVPIVGTAADPNVDTIVSAETNLVIADDTLSANFKNALTNAGIPVLSLSKANSLDELKALYTNLGTALGGSVTGRQQGLNSYDELIKTISDFKDAIPKDVVKSACYLYLNENGELCTLTKGTIEYDLFSYNGAINVFASQETPVVDLELLKISTPSFIFYDNETVLDYLNNDAELSTMGALKNNKTFELKKTDFNRQGTTYEDMIYHMIEFMFITSEATPDEATPQEASVSYTDTQTATEAETQDDTSVGFVE